MENVVYVEIVEYFGVNYVKCVVVGYVGNGDILKDYGVVEGFYNWWYCFDDGFMNFFESSFICYVIDYCLVMVLKWEWWYLLG